MNISEQIDDFIRTEGKGNARDAVNVALARIERLELSLPKWLPYPENKPKPYSIVLATIETIHDKWVETVAYSETGFVLPGRGETKNITHWMEIPTPA